MLGSLGFALTPTFLCAMTGMALLVILDADPSLGRRRTTRFLLLSTLIIAFTFLCVILIQLPIQPLGKLVLATGAMLFLLPATFQLTRRAKEGQIDKSPLLWHWRCRPWWREARQCLLKLDQLEIKLKKRPLHAILRLKAMETALLAGEDLRALYHAHILDEILPMGSAHAHVLSTTSEILAKNQERSADAIPVLRRLDALYPEHRKIKGSPLWSSQSSAPNSDEKRS